MLVRFNRADSAKVDSVFSTFQYELIHQADVEMPIKAFLTSDVKCQSIFKLLSEEKQLSFKIINIQTPFNEQYGVLGL